MKTKLFIFAVCLLTVLCAAYCVTAENGVVDYSTAIRLPWMQPASVTAVTPAGVITYRSADGRTFPAGLLPEMRVSDAGEGRMLFTLGASDETWSPEGPLDVQISLSDLQLPENAALSLVKLDGQERVAADFGLNGEDVTLKFRAELLGKYALIARVRKVSVVNRTGANVVLGGTIDLEAVLTGFEGENVTVIWEMDRGSGWEEAGTGLTHSYTATAESVRWQFRVRVRIAPEA